MPESEALTPDRAYNRYVLVALTSVYTLNCLDGGVIALLLQPIKRDLHLSDTQLGFLTGIAFGIFYATLGLPIARWADRGNRVTITSMAIGIWGATVMSCVFVANFAQLTLARIATAVGEAGCMPPTYSLLGDYFPEPAQRTRAMTVYMLSGPLAALVSFTVGGWLNDHYGWRMTFFFVGIPGLFAAALVKLTIREPRLHQHRAGSAHHTAPRTATVLNSLWQRRSARNLSVALILLYTMGNGLGPWYAAFMIRSHGMSTAELGLWLGLLFSSGGLVGVCLGGYVVSRWFAGDARGQLRFSAAAVAALVPSFLVFLLAQDRYWALVALLPLLVAFSVFLGPTFALLQQLVNDEMRATALAIVMLFANLIGTGIGAQVVGALSDLLFPVLGSDSLRYAMLAMSLVALWAAYHFWQAGKTVKADLAVAC